MLSMLERRVSASERTAFLHALPARRVAAKAGRVHLWVFEHAEEPGRFVEFTEAAHASDLASLHEGQLPAPLWRAVPED